METGLNAFKEALHLKHVEAGEYSPLALAYIGDAVYELAIRTLVMIYNDINSPICSSPFPRSSAILSNCSVR